MHTFPRYGRRTAELVGFGPLTIGRVSDWSYAGDDFYCDLAVPRAGELEVVFQDEHVLAFHHTRPFWSTHIVVVPKRHLPLADNRRPRRRVRHPGLAIGRAANNTRTTPTTVFSPAPTVGEAPGSCVDNSPASSANSPTVPATLTRQPTRSPTVRLFACGDNNMRTIVMIVVMLAAIPIARGTSSAIGTLMPITDSWIPASAAVQRGHVLNGVAVTCRVFEEYVVGWADWGVWGRCRSSTARRWA